MPQWQVIGLPVGNGLGLALRCLVEPLLLLIFVTGGGEAECFELLFEVGARACCVDSCVEPVAVGGHASSSVVSVVVVVSVTVGSSAVMATLVRGRTVVVCSSVFVVSVSVFLVMGSFLGYDETTLEGWLWVDRSDSERVAWAGG